jgi:hypothetical protein
MYTCGPATETATIGEIATILLAGTTSVVGLKAEAQCGGASVKKKGAAIIVTGAAFMATFEINTPAAQRIAHQIIYGIGVGMAFQANSITLQTMLRGHLFLQPWYY